jgi:hypothetical protein
LSLSHKIALNSLFTILFKLSIMDLFQGCLLH